MAWFPIANIVPQYVDENGDPFSGAVLKAYKVNTLTAIPFSTDNTGSTTVNSVALNASGNPEVSGNVVIPHIDQDYKLALYPDQTAADSDSGALWTVDDIDLDSQNTDIVDSVSDIRGGSFSIDRIWLSGYYGVGTPGGGPLYRDSSDTTTSDNGGTVFVDSGGVRWKRPDVGYVSAERFGAKGDGNTDDADALQTSATAAEGQSWVLESESYATSKQIDVPSCHVVCRAGSTEIDGSSIADVGAPDDAILLFGGGSHTALPDLNTDVAASDVDVAFASGHGLSVGDYFVIYNPTDSSFSGFRAYYRAGEWCQVAEVIDSTTVRLNAPLYAGYAAADVDNYKVDIARYSFTGHLSAIASGSSFAIRGMRFRRVADTDLSGLRSVVENAHSGINISQCVHLSGSGVTGRTYGDSSTDTDYGMVVSNSQHIHIEGFFSANRHGVAHSSGDEIGAVPVRDTQIRGTVSMIRERETSLALNWHGNTENCSFEGTVIGGVNIAGNHHTVRGTIYDNGSGILVYGGEMLGHDFDFSGVRFVSRNDVLATGRGAFDVGGNNQAINTSTIHGGTICLRGTTWEVPEVLEQIIRWRNRGATPSEPMVLDCSGAKFTRTNATLDHLLFTGIVSGDNLSYLGLEGVWVDQSQAYSLSNVDRVVKPKESGTETLTTSTGVNSVSASITFDREYPSAPAVLVSSSLQSSGGTGERILAYAQNVTTTGFDLALYTADTNNFNDETDVDVHWSAG